MGIFDRTPKPKRSGQGGQKIDTSVKPCPYKGCVFASTSVNAVKLHMKAEHGS